MFVCCFSPLSTSRDGRQCMQLSPQRPQGWSLRHLSVWLCQPSGHGGKWPHWRGCLFTLSRRRARGAQAKPQCLASSCDEMEHAGRGSCGFCSRGTDAWLWLRPALEAAPGFGKEGWGQLAGTPCRAAASRCALTLRRLAGCQPHSPKGSVPTPRCAGVSPQWGLSPISIPWVMRYPASQGDA